jgi:ATP-binding cassette, subfamily B, fatty acid transporter
MVSMTAPPHQRIGSVALAGTERSRDFRDTAVRVIKKLMSQRGLSAAVIFLGVTDVVFGVIGPRILGHATDLVFNGVIGRQLPVGITKEQAVEAARARGDETFADLLSRTNVRPGVGVDFGAVGQTLLLAVALYLVATLLAWVHARLLIVMVQRTMVALRADIEDKVHRLPLSYFDARQRGELLSRTTNDIENIQTSLTVAIGEQLTSVLAVIAALVMMLTISPLLAGITLLIVPLWLLVTWLIARRAQPLFVAQWSDTGRLNAHIEETYSGFTLVKTFGRQTAAREQFSASNDDVYQASFGAHFKSSVAGPATMLIGNLGYVAVAVVGGLQVATGQITVGSMQAFIQYVRQFNGPLSQVAALYSTLQSGMASAERVFGLLDATEEEPDGEVSLPSSNGQGPMGGRDVGEKPTGLVEFAHVNFSYRPGAPVIEDLSLVAEPGSTVAIVGPTGAGKTTLVNLLMRFYEMDSGRILIDGVDIASMSRRSLRSRIGMVLQDTWLFGGTIAENIAYGRPGATEEEVVAAAKAAYVERFVHTLPDGYQTRVSDDGGNLSAGEKQLITVARAFLARPQLLILDEATSSVDTRTELLIQHAIRELRRDRTSFIIAHRLSTIRHADLILVIEAGKIVERGAHAELLARRGAYWAMARAP